MLEFKTEAEAIEYCRSLEEKYKGYVLVEYDAVYGNAPGHYWGVFDFQMVEGEDYPGRKLKILEVKLPWRSRGKRSATR